ncbi:uncharacterized protein LOC106050212 isoform X1 [Biomphalaria glabrata]|uniref:Uncharacterized protein LOC106050212 isoform X1 n=2 Tax=Biomphalaria glabrata TaxID=6526 RepID=A0A9W3ADC7_BIOGL|nr:uncharacterized protein LOC106050212 isoform X1 [Biomphalaria glabrata]
MTSQIVNQLQRHKKTKSSRTGPTSLSTVFKLAASSLNATRGIELRCYKFSPHVSLPSNFIRIDLFEFEAERWRETFNTMGRLQELHLKEASPFTTLSKAPYHCPALSSDFKVAYGKMSQVDGASVKGSFKPKKEVKVSYCNCIFSSNLPKIGEPVVLSSLPRRVLKQESRVFTPYLPTSTVMVKYNRNMYDVETICEWLQKFGPFVFSIRKGDHTLIVSFETMQSAYDAVNTPLHSARIVIYWLDPKLNNYGHYCAFKNYTVETDATWQKLLNQIIRKEKGIMKANTPSSGKALRFDT